MILTGQLRYLMKDLWEVKEISSTHVVCKNYIDEEKYIEILKQKRNVDSGDSIFVDTYIQVSIPLENGRYKTFFPSEMSAYEYIENFVMDPIDNFNIEEEFCKLSRKPRGSVNLSVESKSRMKSITQN